MDTPKKGRSGAPKPIRYTIAEIDQEILRLLVRRANLLAKIRDKGAVRPEDEKFLRESWQNDVARVSRNPELSGRFFSLLQQVSFLPQPGGPGETRTPGAQRREAFNLAPAQLPVKASLICPLSEWQTAAWLYLAAASGQPTRISPCLQSDALVDFVRCLTQMDAGASREEDAIFTRQGAPMGAPDKVIHAGPDEFCLYLIIAHYAGRHGRVKLTSDSSLGLLDLSCLRRFLPELGCRLINIVPKTGTLPIRLETSGVLPAAVAPAKDIPAGFVEALILAAPFYSSPLAIDLARQPAKAEILARTMPLLKASGTTFQLDRSALLLEPGLAAIPARPQMAVEPKLATFLPAFAFALGGNVTLTGRWPEWPSATALWQLCQDNGFRRGNDEISAEFVKPSSSFTGTPEMGQSWHRAFACALAACSCLRGGKAKLPADWQSDPDVVDFLRITGTELASSGELTGGQPYKGLAWNAPTAAWGMALALAACARPKAGFPLGNPGIVSEFWPHFWHFYNSLPEPRQRLRKKEPEPDAPARRRIITDAIAVPPELRDEDWD